MNYGRFFFAFKKSYLNIIKRWAYDIERRFEMWVCLRLFVFPHTVHPLVVVIHFGQRNTWCLDETFMSIETTIGTFMNH